MKLLCRRFELDLTATKVMGILNVTPDSFSDGGQHNVLDNALECARKLIEEGAAILDIGGESTRPDAAAVSAEEEWQRVAPVLAAVQELGVPISLDTRRTEVMEKALQHGWVDLINDVSALEDEGALALMADYPDVAICLMHKKGNPEDMQKDPHYDDVVAQVRTYLQERVALCQQYGIATQRLLLDPGFGFGKNLEHNLELMKHLQQLCHAQALPVLIGVSRKRMLGQLTGQNKASDRVIASVTAALAACARGAKIVRVHDVKETVQALQIWQAMGVFL